MAIKVSATNLGAYASNRFCPRCEWVKLNVKPLPYQSFPGIFSSIDSYNKRVVQEYFRRAKTLPPWLAQLGEVASYVEPPSWSKFWAVDEETGVTLRGAADGIFRMVDSSHAIVDYKTAKYTQNQESMYQQYEAQLNAYAYIGARQGLAPVNTLALVYMEPVTDEAAAGQARVVDEAGFSMDFKATVVPVALKPEELIPRLLKKVQQIARMDVPPPGVETCKECDAVDGLLQVMG